MAGPSSGVYHLKSIQETQRVASVSQGNALQVWDVEIGECLYEFRGEEHYNSWVTFTDDGRLACAIYADGRYELYDLMKGELRFSNRLEANLYNKYLLTPDGTLLLSVDLAMSHSRVTVWEIETGVVRHKFSGYHGGVAAAALTPDGRRVAYPIEDGKLSLWDLNTGTVVRILDGNAGKINYLAVAPNGRHAVSGSSKGVVALWDLEGGGAHVLSGRTGMVWSLAISPDGRRAVTGSQNGTCQVWDLLKLRLLATFQADTAVGAVNWAGNQHVLAASHNGAVHILQLKE